MDVKIKKIHPNAKIPFKCHESDFCYDFVATSEEEIAPNVWRYGLGVACQAVRGAELLWSEFIYENGQLDTYAAMNTSPMPISIDLRPRSSIWKTGMVLCNSCGTVDESYTGEIMAVFYHVMPNMPRYKVGDKVVQGKIGITIPISFKEVEELSETNRGEGGFGSTGK